MYGLKQASREWNAEFCKRLFSYGFTQSAAEPCLFVKGEGDTFIALLVYVDDVLVCSPSLPLIQDLKDMLHAGFTIKDLGEAKYFLGMEIVRGSAGTSLNQRKYILDILASTGLTGCKPVSTPFPPGLTLRKNSSDAFDDPEQYRRLIGQLLYLNLTRPDLSYSVQQLSQFMAAPCIDHWHAALHVVKYLKGNPSLGLFFPSCGSLEVRAYSDADWASCPDSRQSLTGFCIFLGDALVSWRCKKQQTVSASSTEAEYRAMSATVRELIWFSYLLKDFQLTMPPSVPLYCDNQSAIHISRNPVFHERTKHIEIDCHIVREYFQKGFLLPTSVSTVDQLADFFTKSLPGPRFRTLLGKMKMLDIHHLPLEGGYRR